MHRSLTRKAAAMAAAGALGVGLIGGAALATVPEPARATTSAALPDGTAATLSRTGTAGDAASAQRRELIRRVLSRLVDTGVITREQAETIVNAFAEARERIGDRVRTFVGNVLHASAEYLGLGEAEIKQRVAGGESLASIAADVPGKSREGLIEALNNAADARLKQAVANGTITPERAEAARAKLTAAIVRIVDHEGPPRAN